MNHFHRTLVKLYALLQIKRPTHCSASSTSTSALLSIHLEISRISYQQQALWTSFSKKLSTLWLSEIIKPDYTSARTGADDLVLK